MSNIIDGNPARAGLLSGVFTAEARKASTSRKKRHGSPLFTMRLTPDERAKLEEAAKASGLALATYIKVRLLNIPSPSSRTGGSGRRPDAETVLIARLLAVLGEARLANNLNQLAKHANLGTLEVSKDTENELLSACAEVHAMRRDLIAALGLKSQQGGNPSSCAKASEDA